jgi:hypothetical protein
MAYPPRLWGLPLHDVVIPLIAWTIIGAYYVYQMYRRITDNRGAIENMKDSNYYHHNYFYHVSEKQYNTMYIYMMCIESRYIVYMALALFTTLRHSFCYSLAVSTTLATQSPCHM